MVLLTHEMGCAVGLLDKEYDIRIFVRESTISFQKRVIKLAFAVSDSKIMRKTAAG